MITAADKAIILETITAGGSFDAIELTRTTHPRGEPSHMDWHEIAYYLHDLERQGVIRQKHGGEKDNFTRYETTIKERTPA